MISTISSKLILILKAIIPILLLFGAWQLVAIIISDEFFVPTIPTTLGVLKDLLKQGEFYLNVFYSLMRVVAGLLIGSSIGFALAILSYKIKYAEKILTPFFSVVKATPIASIILVFYVQFTNNVFSIIIACLMATPIIWQNVLDAFKSIPAELSELCDAYEFPALKRFRILTLPALLRYFIPAFITCSGLCWKASVSAEIIVYNIKSIGKYINDAGWSDTPTVFACTLVMIILSILLEKIIKLLLGRCEKWL